jgi:hypothetical protein
MSHQGPAQPGVLFGNAYEGLSEFDAEDQQEAAAKTREILAAV